MLYLPRLCFHLVVKPRRGEKLLSETGKLNIGTSTGGKRVEEAKNSARFRFLPLDRERVNERPRFTLPRRRSKRTNLRCELLYNNREQSERLGM